MLQIIIPGRHPQTLDNLKVTKVELEPGARPQKAKITVEGMLSQQNHGIVELDTTFSLTLKEKAEDSRFTLKAQECRIEWIGILVDGMDVIVEISGRIEI